LSEGGLVAGDELLEHVGGGLVLHASDLEAGGVGGDVDADGPGDSTERFGGGGGVADLVDDLTAQFQVDGTVSLEVEARDGAGGDVVGEVGLEGSVGEDDALFGGIEVVGQFDAGEGKDDVAGGLEGHSIDGLLGD